MTNEEREQLERDEYWKKKQKEEEELREHQRQHQNYQGIDLNDQGQNSGFGGF